MANVSCSTAGVDRRAMLVTGLMLALLLPLTAGCGGFWRYGFCLPASHLAAAFMHVPCLPHDGGYRLVHDALSVHVTLACSAAGFFVLSTALLFGLSCAPGRRLSLRPLLWIVPLCYGVTLTANMTRIVLGWYAGLWARAHLRENFWGGVHTGVGVLVFLVFLIGVYALARLNDRHRAGIVRGTNTRKGTAHEREA